MLHKDFSVEQKKKHTKLRISIVLSKSRNDVGVICLGIKIRCGVRHDCPHAASLECDTTSPTGHSET